MRNNLNLHLNLLSYSKLSNLEKHINSKIIGQYEVIPKLVETLRIGEMGLADKDRPKGSFLFLGPPGVGKTETVKDLGRTLGIFVIVTNSSSNFRYTDMAKLLKGLC